MSEEDWGPFREMPFEGLRLMYRGKPSEIRMWNPRHIEGLKAHCAALGKVWFWHATFRWPAVERLAAIAQAEAQAVGSRPDTSLT